MKAIKLCGECADYDKKRHRCRRGASREDDPRNTFYDDCPLPEAVPVVHSRWIETKEQNKKRCGRCDVIHLIAQYPNGNANFCPNCGAKMDGGNYETD